MCGRFTQHHEPDAVAERFEAAQTLFAPTPRYNVAPDQIVPVVLSRDGTRVLDGFKWGLVPGWAKDVAALPKMINARSETLAEKPSFRAALARRRCLIPADGFYEWDKSVPGVKTPYHFRLRTGALFAFAGLWEEWIGGGSATPLRTCAIVTTSANATVGRVHDRMPVMLAPGAEEVWLDGSVRDTDLLRSLLVPYPDDVMEAFAVSRRVNAATNEGADLIARV